VKLDLTEVLQEVGRETDFEGSFDVNFEEDGLKLTQPAKVELHLTNTGSSVLIEGQITSEAELECSRCLKPFTHKLEAEVAEEFVKPAPETRSKKELELKEDDFVYPIDSDNTIDLTELIRQELLLALPIKALCKEEK